MEINKENQKFSARYFIFSAYSYCNRKVISEEVYQTGWDFDKLHDAMQWMTDEMIEKLTPDILRDRWKPNKIYFFPLNQANQTKIIQRKFFFMTIFKVCKWNKSDKYYDHRPVNNCIASCLR